MDIDIDISPKTSIDKIFGKGIVKASRIENDEMKPHPVGYYFQKVPIDKETNLCAIPYDQAEDEGFFKMDFINNNALSLFESKDQMNNLLKKEPNWSLLMDKDVVDRLFHLAGHYDIVSMVKPKNVLEIADILALIRPGKYKILDKYLKNKKLARKELYTIREKSHMKKSHAVAYALLIKLQLHLCEQGKL